MTNLSLPLSPRARASLSPPAKHGAPIPPARTGGLEWFTWQVRKCMNESPRCGKIVGVCLWILRREKNTVFLWVVPSVNRDARTIICVSRDLGFCAPFIYRTEDFFTKPEIDRKQRMLLWGMINKVSSVSELGKFEFQNNFKQWNKTANKDPKIITCQRMVLELKSPTMLFDWWSRH